MLGEKRINELIVKYCMKYAIVDGQEVVQVQNQKGLTQKTIKEIKENKPEILAELKARKEEREKIEAEKETAKEAEKQAYLNGTKKFELTSEDYDYPRYIILSAVAADLLKELGVAKDVGYDTVLKADAEKALGTSFTYQQALDFISPIKKAEQEKEEAEKARIAAIFETAKETGKKQVLKSWMEECNDPKEECSTDSVTLWAMPDGSKKTTRTHTW